jgi:DNA-binding NtrC family response regulator
MNSTSLLKAQTSVPRTALVVGPDPEFAAEVAATLPGWNIERVANNLSALAMVEQRSFDLVFTGENTSGRADVDLLRQIRRVRPHTRLIILTNDSTPADVIASMRERAFSYFSTPYSPTSFAEMIRLAAEEPCWDGVIRRPQTGSCNSSTRLLICPNPRDAMLRLRFERYC